ncbi:UDP-glucose 4-epimerase [Rhodothalassium salexigens DSM 2132]|uniref:UDP-glucose 4-epimerase n=1 Tax=Rhodothalassium salexigens DSM 2132 TaxID=1188247 RepID=A0A4R2PR38_RHOSA|nr:NAD(P)-dependent oxidoreductase [Rhodothalassium salexigens]MBB4210114.1 UDP-glucose 4-epimerase [Rhodothalassium salexigens DSM 2132]MBK1638438.1 NAD-dependent epimerase [Rhodothalassium salexigens DSM 2132]TCP38279.1 UDP-glucose 4-epimerase [Rhodothalassium salexigens DSM 2132]
MTILITGSSGHLGEALMRLCATRGLAARGLDVKPGPYTDLVGSIDDRAVVARAMAGVRGVLHAATLHKPHVVTHAAQAFVDVNVSGTLALLEAAVAERVAAFVFTSTTSAFGSALTPGPEAPAAWITEDVIGAPKNIYGATKTAAEGLCHLFHRQHGLACVVLRTSRFFPEQDDNRAHRLAFDDTNLKANEFLHRRVDLEDAAEAHLLALSCAGEIGFDRLIVSATPPFARAEAQALRRDPTGVVAAHVPAYRAVYQRLGFRLPDDIARVYDNARARRVLGWRPRYDFARVVAQLDRGETPGSALARAVGAKGYHDQVFADGPFPVN